MLSVINPGCGPLGLIPGYAHSLSGVHPQCTSDTSCPAAELYPIYALLRKTTIFNSCHIWYITYEDYKQTYMLFSFVTSLTIFGRRFARTEFSSRMKPGQSGTRLQIRQGAALPSGSVAGATRFDSRLMQLSQRSFKLSSLIQPPEGGGLVENNFG